MSPPKNMTELTAHIDWLVRHRGYAKTGERIVIVAGASLGTPGTLNSVIMHTLGDGWIGDMPREFYPSIADEMRAAREDEPASVNGSESEAQPA